MFKLPEEFPTEILARIFECVCKGYTVRVSLRSEAPPRYTRVRATLLAPVVLSQVCHEWRDIALSTPSLWSSIFIDGNNKGRKPGEREFSLLRLGVTEVVNRAKMHPVRLTIFPPDKDWGENGIWDHWQAIVDPLFGVGGPAIRRIHFIESSRGMEGINLEGMLDVTLEDFRGPQPGAWYRPHPSQIGLWPKKLLLLTTAHEHFSRLDVQGIQHVTELALIAPNTMVDLKEFFGTLKALKQLVSLQLNLGSMPDYPWQPNETLELSNLRTLELQNCERTFLHCMPWVHLPALVNLDWVITGYWASANVRLEDSLVQNAPMLQNFRVCCVEAGIWAEGSTRRPVSFTVTSTSSHFQSWGGALSTMQCDPVRFLSNFTSCRRSPTLCLPKIGPKYIEEIHSAMPWVGRHWKAELESPDGEVQATKIQLDPIVLLSLKRALRVLGSSQLTVAHRSLEVVIGYPSTQAGRTGS